MASYDRDFVFGLEWIWGKGFLSPGGDAEVSEILRDTDLASKKILDVGCGIGGIDRLLVTRHSAGKVVGIDVEMELIQRAIEDSRAAGLESEIEYIVVAEGPLKFADASFDVVFSKDSIIHIEDKAGFFKEAFRVLRDGGIFVGSDWLAGPGYSDSENVRDWLDVIGLEFNFSNPDEFRRHLSDAEFENVGLRDRNAWYADEVRKEIARVTGDNRETFIDIVGEEQADQRLRSSRAKLKVVDEGNLRPTHFRAVKP